MTWHPGARMGLCPLEPTYCTPNIPYGIQNTTTAYREATISKIPTKSEKDIDSSSLIEQEQVSGNPAALTTDQKKTKSEEGNRTSPFSTINRPPEAKPHPLARQPRRITMPRGTGATPSTRSKKPQGPIQRDQNGTTLGD